MGIGENIIIRILGNCLRLFSMRDLSKLLRWNHYYIILQLL